MGAPLVQGRVISLDALRGLDMLMIIGMSETLRALAEYLPEEWGTWLAGQMGHVEWQGLAVYDLIFPLFVFISGAAMHLSLTRGEERGLSKLKLGAKLWQRAAQLIMLGWLVNGSLTWELHSMRIASVLGLIGISCAVAGCLALALRRWWKLAMAAWLILLAVGLLQYYGGDMTPEGCVNARVDALLCPGRLHDGCLDPEGPLCIASAVALCLCGMLAGRVLCAGSRRWAAERWRTALALEALGSFLLVVSLCSGVVIKKIWTPAFVLSAAGVGYLLLALFHSIFDSERGAAWSTPLRVVGTNALFIYLFTSVLPFGELSQRIFCGLQHKLLPAACLSVAPPLCSLLLAWLLCYYLWRKNSVLN